MDLQNILRIVGDSALSCNFVIEIEGDFLAGFRKCSGLSEEIIGRGINEINSSVTTEIMESVYFPPITLEKGIAFSDTLFSWYKKRRDWKPQENEAGLLEADFRKDVSIVQLKWVKNVPFEVDRWDLPNCFVKKYVAPEFDSNNYVVSVSRMVLGREEVINKPYNFENANTVVEALRLAGIF